MSDHERDHPSEPDPDAFGPAEPAPSVPGPAEPAPSFPGPAEPTPSPEAFEEEEEPYDPHRGWGLRAIAVLAILGLIALFVARPAPEPPEVGGRAPAFELPYLLRDGTLSSDELEGRPVVLNFWASWCIPCREEMPMLEEMHQRYRDQGVIIIGIDVQDTPERAEAFVRDRSLTYPMVVDAEQVLSRPLEVFGLPQTFFIDHNYEFHPPGGEARVLGAISAEEVERRIEAMLEDLGGSAR